MTKTLRALCAALLVGILSLGAVACSNDADVASENLSTAADNFEIPRRIVFYNGITDTYMLEITGLCAIEEDGSQLEVTCKVGDGEFKKHFLGRSDNVTYFVEQTEGANASTSQYRVTFKPSTIVPDVDAR